MTHHNDFPSGDSTGGTSRRGLLRALAVTPVVVPVVASPWGEMLATLHARHDDPPATLARTRGGRSLGRARYHRAKGFFPVREPESGNGWHDFLYFAGITAQLGLSSHLLDVGFEGSWCTRYIGLCVAKALAYANATGFGHDCPDMARLATVLTPYWQWNRPRLFGEPMPHDGGFTPVQVRASLRALLDRVRDVTGHPRPNGWRRPERAARA